MRIKHTDYSTTPPTVEHIEVSEARANWIMKTNPDGTPIITAEDLIQCHRRYSDENREID
jgi:hypothetical protein